jgi:hypothetical protein
MLEREAFLAMLSAMVLSATLGRLAAEERDSGYRLPKGTRAIAFKLSKGQEVPDDAVPGMAVDIVGEISEPIKTGIALLNVKLLEVGAKPLGADWPDTVRVELTTAQQEVLALMLKHGTKLGIRLHAKEKPKK